MTSFVVCQQWHTPWSTAMKLQADDRLLRRSLAQRLTGELGEIGRQQRVAEQRVEAIGVSDCADHLLYPAIIGDRRGGPREQRFAGVFARVPGLPPLPVGLMFVPHEREKL